MYESESAVSLDDRMVAVVGAAAFAPEHIELLVPRVVVDIKINRVYPRLVVGVIFAAAFAVIDARAVPDLERMRRYAHGNRVCALYVPMSVHASM